MTLSEVLFAVARSLKPFRARLILALGFILLHTAFGFFLIFSTGRFALSTLPIFIVLLFSLHHLLSVFDDWILTSVSTRWVSQTRKKSLQAFLSTRDKSTQNSVLDWSGLQLEIQWLGESIFSLLRGTLRKILQIFVFSVALIWLSPSLFLFCVALFLAVFLLGFFLGRWINREQEDVILAQSAVANFELEAARAMPLVKAFRQAAFFARLHERFLDSTTTRSIRLARLRMIAHPIQIVLFLGTLTAVYAVGSSQVAGGSLTQTSFHSFIAGLSLLHAPLSALSADISSFLSYRSMTFLPLILEDPAEETAQPPSPEPSRIDASQLRFHYPDGPELFTPLDFSLTKGSIIGFEGPNGCGKTTVALLIAGVLKPTGGALEFSPLDSGRSGVSFVDQNGTVFTLNLQENLFLESTPVTEFLQTPYLRQIRSDRINNQLSQEALSSGQRKTISLLRAFEHNHGVLLVDEPENALDQETQQQLRDTLKRFKNTEKLIVLFSHSEFFLSICDQRIRIQPPQPEVS